MTHNFLIRKNSTHYEAIIGGKVFPCAVGRNGLTLTKKEGDGATPIGTFPLRRLFYRPDVYSEEDLSTGLPKRPLHQTHGWCDEPMDPHYNTLVDLQTFDTHLSHENMWRDDPLYNIVVEVGYNDAPIISGHGSAIFIHIARPGYTGTKGCIAFVEADLREIISLLSVGSYITVED
jgi:L,D-peptidoglycan transpeptidase YkuD (ErfK/YbiS/YcfS/YnhG family)